jgi:hypothetical protein
VRQREHVEQLELVVEVVLEPEQEAASVTPRCTKLAVAPLERRADRAAAPPAALREERRANLQELGPRDIRHRPFVENVLPRQHRPAEARLTQRVPSALAVRDVQKRRRRARLPSAASEIRGLHEEKGNVLNAERYRQLLAQEPATDA